MDATQDSQQGIAAEEDAVHGYIKARTRSCLRTASSG